MIRTSANTRRLKRNQMKIINRIRAKIRHKRFNTGIPPISKIRVAQICRQLAKDLEYKPEYIPANTAAPEESEEESNAKN